MGDTTEKNSSKMIANATIWIFMALACGLFGALIGFFIPFFLPTDESGWIYILFVPFGAMAGAIIGAIVASCYYK